jgi:titin
MPRSATIIRTIAAAAVGLGFVLVPISPSAFAAPTAPSGLTATFGPGGVTLAWTDNASNETGYSIERCLGAGCTAFGQIATVSAGATSFSDSYYASGVDRYRVRAFDTTGYSSFSNIAEQLLFSINEVFPVISAGPATGPAALTVTFDGSATTAVNGPISGYAWSFGDNATATGAVVTHTYTAPGVYAASLRATASPFNAADSTAVIITVTAPLLVAPSDLVAAAPVRGQVRLAWTNPVSSATSLTLERCKGTGCTSFSRIAVVGSATSYTDTNVKRHTTYRYRLAASDVTGTVYSNIALAVSG